MKNMFSKKPNQIARSKNSVFIQPEANSIDIDKLNDIIEAVLVFIPLGVSVVDEALLMFSCFPDSWKAFNENIEDWEGLSNQTKMERTINFVVAIKNYERLKTA